MNIISTNAYCSRFLTDWAGPDAMVEAPRDPPRRAGVPRLDAHVHRRRHRRAARRRRGARRRRVPGQPTTSATTPSGTADARRCRRGARVSHPLSRPGRHRRHRPDGVLQGVGPQRAPARLRGGQGRARRRRPHRRPTSTASSPSRWTPTRRWRSAATSASTRSGCSAASPTAAAPPAATVMQAAMAVATGVADVVVVLPRVQRALRACASATSAASSRRCRRGSSWYAPFGLLTPASWVALHARRYMDEYGVTNEDFGRIAVVDRTHAATNPDAWFYERPITLEDHQASRWIVEPVLRLLDCCQESDGGVALVVTSHRTGPRPAPAAGGDRGGGAGRHLRRRDDDELLPRRHHRPARDGRRRPTSCGRSPACDPSDISTAFLYDHFTPFVLMQLEELGFCGRGEAKDFATVERLSLGGDAARSTPAAACSARPTSTA